MISRNEIDVLYGGHPKEMVKKILRAAELGKEIDKNAVIGIKPNLVVAKPCSSGATTSPELVEGIIDYLREHGFSKIVMLEGSWVGEDTGTAFRVCGYDALSERCHVPLIDLQKDSCRALEWGGMKISVCESVLKTDYLINVPVLKGHCQTNMTCALKNMKGCISNAEKRKFHAMGLHKPIAYLNKVLRQDFIIVDAMNGDLDFEEGGNPVPMNRILVGKDPVLMDAYGARLLGFSLDDVPYIKIAEQIGVGSADVAHAEIRELNKDETPHRTVSSRKARQLGRYVQEDCACSACYGSLIHALGRLEERGKLRSLKTRICIGQGYKGKCGDGVGVGACTAKFEKNVPGCPPTAKEIVNFLEENVL